MTQSSYEMGCAPVLTDDVSLKVFLDHLMKLAVQSSTVCSNERIRRFHEITIVFLWCLHHPMCAYFPIEEESEKEKSISGLEWEYAPGVPDKEDKWHLIPEFMRVICCFMYLWNRHEVW